MTPTAPSIRPPLHGRTALVTGAGTGIGAATAVALAAAGADIAVNHPGGQEDQIAALTKQIAQLGRSAITVQADITRPAEVTAMIGEVSDSLGPVDILVNNAGDYPRIRWSDLDEYAWAAALELNLTAHYRCCRAVTADMTRRGRGKIINMGSITARSGRAGLTAYATAKAGLHGLTRSLARELGPLNICVNTIVAGPIEVDRETTLPPGDRTPVPAQLARQCLPRRGHPADIAAAVAFLAGPGADFITGQTLHIDGGWILH